MTKQGNGRSVRKTWRMKLALLRAFRTALGCSQCGESREAALDLHHIDPATKNPQLTKKSAAGQKFTGGSMWRSLSCDKIVAELKKCEVLCSNCHRVETRKQSDLLRSKDPRLNYVKNSKVRAGFEKQLIELAEAIRAARPH